MMNSMSWRNILASGFFSGYFPVAPGTAGTVVAVCIYFFLGSIIEAFLPGYTGIVMLGLALVCFLPGVYLSNWAEKSTSRDDPGFIVIDEMVGYWVTVAFLPFTWHTAIFAFIFFRLMDVIKPEPAYVSQKLKNGWGVMVDDVIAAIYANTLTRISLLFFISFV